MPSNKLSSTSFGLAIRSRRLEMGLTAADVSEQGGPSISSLNRLENGRVESPHPATFRSLDRILGWESGTAHQLFYDNSLNAVAGTPEGSLIIFEDELVELVTWNNLLSKHYAQLGDSTAASFTQRISSITSTLLGRWIDHAIDNGDTMALRFLTNVVSNQPLVPSESPDYTAQLYRRWRLGIIPESELDPDTLQIFLTRKEGGRKNNENH